MLIVWLSIICCGSLFQSLIDWESKSVCNSLCWNGMLGISVYVSFVLGGSQSVKDSHRAAQLVSLQLVVFIHFTVL